MEAAVSEGLKLGRAAVKEAVGRLYLARDQPAEAVKLLTEVYAAAKQIEGTEEQVPAIPDTPASRQLADASKSIASGGAKDVVDIAKAALASARNAGDRPAQVLALKVLAAAYACNRDMDGALQVSKELAKLARKAPGGAELAHALVGLGDALLAAGEPGQALAAAEEAAAAARSSPAGGAGPIAAALVAVYGIHRIMGKAVSAQKAALEVLDAVRGSRRAEAAAQLMVADSHPSSKVSLSAAQDALASFKELGDALGEGAALIALAFAYGSQPERQYEDGVKAAMSAVEIFRERGERVAEALALATASRASALQEDAQKAASLAKEAVQLFREAGMKAGEAYANDLLSDAPYAPMQQTGARLLIDEDSLAHIEISEMATQESLESIVATLHSFHSRGKCEHFKSVVIHIEGAPVPSRLHSYAMATGTFLVGIRSLGLPMISCCWGTIAGPSWGLLLAGDYRVVAQDTTLVTPILRPLECLADLVGQHNYAQLTMEHGTMSALSLLEMGICHQVQKDGDHAQKAATAQAKRISDFPVSSSRQTLTLMCPDAERFIFMR